MHMIYVLLLACVSTDASYGSKRLCRGLTIQVLDTCTMLELRRQIMERLGETSISKCKLVRRSLAQDIGNL